MYTHTHMYRYTRARESYSQTAMLRDDTTVQFKACFFFQSSQKASVRDENRL